MVYCSSASDPLVNSQYQGQGSAGYYWTAARQVPVTVFQDPAPVQPLTAGLAPDTQIAVRYVRRL